MVRVLLYTDQPILAKGLECVIAVDPYLTLTACCPDLTAAKARLASRDCDLAVLDLTPSISLGVLNGLQALAPDCRLLLWADSISGHFAMQALSLGVRGVMRKTLSIESHRQCLHKVASGGLWFEKRVTDSVRQTRHIALTRRESQLVSMLARGMTNRQISAELGVKEGTVKVYLSHLFQKSGAKDRLDLAIHGLKNLSVAGAATYKQGGLRSLLMDTACRQ